MFKAIKRKQVLKAIDKRLHTLELQMQVTANLWDLRIREGREESAKIFKQMYLREKTRHNRLSLYRQAYRAGRERHVL